jgi:hypothetical protein
MQEAAKETVIVVHGTYAAPQAGASLWYEPIEGVPATEGFIAKLNNALQKRGSAARCWAHCSQSGQGFHWSGENNWVARTHAAAELGNYVLKLRNEGWCCHLVAHSHGGNVVLEALPQIATALPANASVGKIVTLGTPFMDTMSPILQRIRRNRSFLTGLARIALMSYILSAVIYWSLLYFPKLIPYRDMFDTATIGIAIWTIMFLVSAIVFALLFFSRKSQTEPIFNGAAQMQPKFLAIGSVMDEPWQLLHYMRNAPNPLAVETNLIRYLISSMRSHISRGRQVARIYERKSYGDLNWRPNSFWDLCI